VELAKEYISYLKAAPKFENRPFHNSNGAHMLAASVQNHVRALRAFLSRLHREGDTDENLMGHRGLSQELSPFELHLKLV